MRKTLQFGIRLALVSLALAAAVWAQSAGRDIGSGAGDIGKGAGKGAAHAAEGAGKGAADVVTLHPIKGAENLGKGAGTAGKDVAAGTVKGTAKIGKGIGKVFKKVL